MWMQQSIIAIGAETVEMAELNEGASSNQVPNMMIEVNVICF